MEKLAPQLPSLATNVFGRELAFCLRAYCVSYSKCCRPLGGSPPPWATAFSEHAVAHGGSFPHHGQQRLLILRQLPWEPPNRPPWATAFSEDAVAHAGGKHPSMGDIVLRECCRPWGGSYPPMGEPPMGDSIFECEKLQLQTLLLL